MYQKYTDKINFKKSSWTKIPQNWKLQTTLKKNKYEDQAYKSGIE